MDELFQGTTLFLRIVTGIKQQLDLFAFRRPLRTASVLTFLCCEILNKQIRGLEELNCLKIFFGLQDGSLF